MNEGRRPTLRGVDVAVLLAAALCVLEVVGVLLLQGWLGGVSLFDPRHPPPAFIDLAFRPWPPILLGGVPVVFAAWGVVARWPTAVQVVVGVVALAAAGSMALLTMVVLGTIY